MANSEKERQRKKDQKTHDSSAQMKLTNVISLHLQESTALFMSERTHQSQNNTDEINIFPAAGVSINMIGSFTLE